MPVVYAELHRLATARLRSERGDHTLQAVSVGWTWGFQAFAGRKLGGGFK